MLCNIVSSVTEVGGIADIMLVSLSSYCLAREVYHASSIGKARVMLTIHNMDSTGECRQEEFAMTGTGYLNFQYC